jgi:hypothetical protein
MSFAVCAVVCVSYCHLPLFYPEQDNSIEWCIVSFFLCTNCRKCSGTFSAMQSPEGCSKAGSHGHGCHSFMPNEPGVTSCAAEAAATSARVGGRESAWNFAEVATLERIELDVLPS